MCMSLNTPSIICIEPHTAPQRCMLTFVSASETPTNEGIHLSHYMRPFQQEKVIHITALLLPRVQEQQWVGENGALAAGRGGERGGC